MSRKTHLASAVLLLLFSQSVQAELDLTPIEPQLWNRDYAAHLAARAGFGATTHELDALQRLTPRQAVKRYLLGLDVQTLSEFEPSGIFDEGLDPFPPSRPATTALAKAQGEALGVSVKAGGSRPLQPVVNKFFYWLRASRLETDRVAYWWANRMLATSHPLQEKMALFWHGHFATNEDKVRDYRKMLQQLQLFQQLGLGSFRDLMVAVAQNPAMLVFLDAGVNTKNAPNENFAREIMELFTMGVGHYTERDVQEAARAFTGWNVQGLEFHINESHHDSGEKEFLSQRGNFDGVDVIDIIMQQDATAQFIATKLYRYFVNEEVSAAESQQLGALFQELDLNIANFLQALFLSNDFYLGHNRGTRVKGPVELMIGTYRDLGLQRVPGVPDFNVTSDALGQRLMHPPTVAGWSTDRAWITPSLLFERGNFVLDVMFPDIGFVPPDRYPTYTPEIVNVQKRLRQGMTISEATKPTGVAEGENEMAASNLLADADEDFNTRLGSMRGWQMALERVKPLSRHTAAIDLTGQVMQAGLTTPAEVVAWLAAEYFVVPLQDTVKVEFAQQLADALGTTNIVAAQSYLEEPLRQVLHRLLSLPEYQLN